MPLTNPVSLKVAPKVAVVISGQNCAQFLQEAIESVFAQTHPATEIIYSDDCSIDNSLAIASNPGFTNFSLYRIVSSGVHQGVCAARNRGANACSSPYIIFMDTDDILPQDYISCMVKDIIANPNAPFIYPSTKCFGSSNTLWKNLEWAKYDKWVQNQVSTTAVWKRSVFVASGGWQDLPTMWDYDLAIRCSRFGTPVAGSATLSYRIHDDSQSEQLFERFPEVSLQYKELIRRKNATLGIACIYSGRLPEILPEWLCALSRSIKYHLSLSRSDSKPSFKLLVHHPSISSTSSIEQVYNHKCEHAYIHRCLNQFSDSFSSVSVETISTPMDYSTEELRRQSVCQHMADTTNRIQLSLQTDLIWLVEDDVIVPIDACYELFKACTADSTPPIGVSAQYWNRHQPAYVLGGFIRNGRHIEPHVSFSPKEEVDFVGTGCLMYWRDRPASPKVWRPISRIENATAHDWAWSEDVQAAGGKLFVLGNVQCKHMVDSVEYV